MKHDESRPEPILFLLEAADAMEAYKKDHGVYPQAWHDLDISFANGPYNEGDPGTRPSKHDSASWRPKGCDYTYWIVVADKTRFVVEARSQNNKAEYEIASGMSKPRSLLDKTAGSAQTPNKHDAEAVTFLTAALLAFRRYHHERGEYPQSWRAVKLHWECSQNRAGDPAAVPPNGIGRVWRPVGCHYSFTIIAADKNRFEIQSSNAEGLEDYAISSAQTSPTALIKK